MDEEMDSLFEGMVLLPPAHQLDLDLEPEPEPDQPPPPPPPQLPSTHFSQPLDDNLFSDLTLVTYTNPNPNPPLESFNSPPPLLSRQFSSSSSARKKKRAAGLRIGYGRESSPTTSIQNVAPGDQDEYDDDNSTGGEETRNRNDISTSLEKAQVKVDAQHEPIVEEEQQECRIQDQSPIGIEHKFEEIKDHISQTLKSAQEAVAAVSAARKDSIKRRRKLLESLSQATAKYRDLEKELEQACETEDFEKAERVSESLSCAEKERELLAASLRVAEAECDSLESRMQDVLETQIQAEEECASLLKTFAEDSAGYADLVRRNAEENFLKEMEEWFSSSEAVQVKTMELEIESQIMHEARLVVKTSIEHSVVDEHKEKELLYKKKEKLTEELEELLALVKEKEAEIAETDSNIDKVEKRIAGVISSFQGVESSVDIRYNNLESALSQMDMENESLSRRKEEIDSLLSLEEARSSKIRKLSRISTDEANMYLEEVVLRRSLLQFILRYKEDKVRLAKTEEKLSDDVQRLKQDISAARVSLQELSSEKSSIQQEIESWKQRVMFLEKRVPELEAEKKVAASARNFKEAGRIAAEAKAYFVEREELQAKIEGMALELRKLEEKICCTIDIVRETEAQMSSKEKELGIARFQRLTLVAGAAAAERSAALELGDFEEADILLVEAQTASDEARRLQPIYDIKEEDIASMPKYFSVELVSKMGGKQLQVLAASAHI